MNKTVLILMLLLLSSAAMYGQDGKDYLQRIETSLKSGDCKDASKWYLTYKNVTGKTDASIERRIKECENKGVATPATTTTAATKVPIEWVNIPAGTFTMGSPANEPERYDDEIQHQVTLKAFKMSKYVVTFAQYDAFCEATGREKPSDSGWGRGNRPVINVSWHDAVDFCMWVGGGCRLPTEAEWEYACRADTNTPFYTGYNITTSQANYNGNNPYNNNAKGEYRQRTVAVGSFSPNPWGLYEMHGNVWEWCNDWFGTYSSSAQTNPQGATSGTSKVHRGGSWNNIARYCRSAIRYYHTPSNRSYLIGFRVVSSE